MRNRWPPSYSAARQFPQNIFLVGMMGAGKTSVGRLLAKRLGKNFYDSDQVIEARTGVKIPVIFELEGESGFRQRESAVIDELSALGGVVLATGGGAILAPCNREWLRERGVVVYLRAVVQDLWNRTRHDKNRPLLRTADPLGRLTELLNVRDPIYSEVAHVTVDTGRQSLRALVERLESRLRDWEEERTDPAAESESRDAHAPMSTSPAGE